MRFSLPTFFTIVLLVLVASVGTSIAAGKQWPPYPLGPTGAYPPAVDGCEAGSYVVGFRIREGAWFDKIGPICGFLDAAGKSWANPRVPAMRGGDGGGGPNEYKCRTNEVVGAVEVWADNDVTVVTNLTLTCISLNDAEDKRTVRVGKVANTGGHHVRNQSCDPHQRVIAVKVLYGKFVNALGVWCAPLKAAAYSGCRIGNQIRTDVPDSACSEVQEEARKTGCIRRLLTVDDYAACLRAQKPVSSGCLIGGVVRKDIADTDCKEAQTTGCIRRLLTDVQYAACLKAQKPEPAKNVPTPTANKAKVVAPNKIYKDKSGNDTPANTVCSVRSGDTADVLDKGPDQWVHLGNISGACAGKSGFAWNDGEIVLP
jgi:hypothetical protein